MSRPILIIAALALAVGQAGCSAEREAAARSASPRTEHLDGLYTATIPRLPGVRSGVWAMRKTATRLSSEPCRRRRKS